MVKKFMIIIMLLKLSIGYTTVYASGSRPIDYFENRYQVENTAGMTSDQLDEMAANSPHGLTPLQGLLLWMFAMVAFLKLAQKMDNLLQSLGLNVTQTGGRAVGDLVIAGMALRHAGSAISKGMGMFGLGNGGTPAPGGAPNGTGSGTGKIGATGPAPILSGAPGGGHAAAGGASSVGGKAAGTPSSSTAPGGAPKGGSASGAVGHGATTAVSRNPIGRAVSWMKQDGFAQGAIKAVPKSGAIGLTSYTAKAGAAKIGKAVSARLGGNEIPSDPNKASSLIKSGSITPGSRPAAGPGSESGSAGVNKDKNPEEYRDSRPLERTDEQLPIPSAINSGSYQDTGSFDSSDYSGEPVSTPASSNTDDYNEVTTPNTTLAAGSIPAPADDGYDGGSAAVWHDSNPVKAAEGTVSAPPSANSETWNEANPSVSGGTPAPSANVDMNIPTAATQPIPAAAPSGTQQANQTAVSSVQPGAVAIAQVSTASGLNNIDNTTRQDMSTGSAARANSSESVSVVKESSVSHELITQSQTSVLSGINGADTDNGSGGDVYQSREITLNNQTIPAGLTQNNIEPTIGSQQDTSAASHTASADHAPTNPAPVTQTDTGVSTERTVTQADTGVSPERPATTQPEAPHPSANPAISPVSEPVSAPQPNNTIAQQTTNITGATYTGTSKPLQTTVEPTAAADGMQGHGTNTPPKPKEQAGNTRPITKAKSKNPSLKTRKGKS